MENHLVVHPHGTLFGCNAKSDTDVTTGSKKSKKYIDPFLKLYSGIPLMYSY
jgi:hypothetical protein